VLALITSVAIFVSPLWWQAIAAGLIQAATLTLRSPAFIPSHQGP
jgi:hypothetical protein